MSKYVGNSIDSTKHFDTTFIDFTWTFNADQTFSKSWKSRQYLRSASYDTTFGVDPSGNPIITNIDTNYSFNPYYTDHSNAGRWVLFNGNDYVQLRDSANAPAMDYRIESHTSKNLVLTRGNQEMHLGAK